EGSFHGDFVYDPGDDRDSITHAIAVALNNNVQVSPITPDRAPAGVVKLAQDLAAGTHGRWYSTSSAAGGIGGAIADIVRSACDAAGGVSDAGPNVANCGG